MKLKEPCRSGFVRRALPDDLGNEEEMGGREGRPPQPYFLYIDLSPQMINTKFHNGIKKGLDVRKKYLSGRERDGVKKQIAKTQTHCTHKDTDIS